MSPSIARFDSDIVPPESPEAFADWVQPHMGPMARLAIRLSTPSSGDDVLQEALVRAWIKRRQFDPRRGSAASWLLAITADQARRVRRKNSRVLIGSTTSVVTSIDDRLDVEVAVAGLPRRQRLAVDCYYYAGLSVGETAAVMRCSAGTVKSALFDARERLRQLLEL